MNKHGHPYYERAAYTWSADSVRLLVTPTEAARFLGFYIQETGYFKTSDTYFTERQNLNSFLLVYTLSGHGVLKYEGLTYDLRAGNCFFINCLPHHYYETPAGEQWEFLWVHFHGNAAQGYYEEFVKNGFRILDFSAQETVEQSFWNILRINQERNAKTEILSSNRLSNILTACLLETIEKNAPSVYMPDYLKTALKQIDLYFKTELTLGNLAKQSGVSKYYLARNFKKYMGVTVNEYIILARISYAKELLKYSRMSVSEITFAIGMNNVSHFINLFKAREGATPLAYRKEWHM